MLIGCLPIFNNWLTDRLMGIPHLLVFQLYVDSVLRLKLVAVRDVLVEVQLQRDADERRNWV